MTQRLASVNAFLERQHGLQIAGQSVAAISGATLPVYNPADDQLLTQVAAAQAADVDIAVAAARAAFAGEWSGWLPAQRERALLRLADLLEANSEQLAQLESLDNGKSLPMARLLDVGHSAQFCRYMAGWATKISGQSLDLSIPMGGPYRAFTVREPVGVVGAIIPWNFPLIMAVWKIAPALACGCTIVLKPAEETPLTALRLAELCLEAGLPAGVVNVITGYGHEAGAALAAHPGIDKVAFTGSTEVGKLVGHAALNNMTRFSLELGGKSPVIVLPDMDPQAAAAGAAGAIFFNQGQVCAAGSRLYVARQKFDAVTEALAKIAEQLRLGSGFDPNSQINPLVSRKQQQRVCRYIHLGLEQGAQALCGGEAGEGAGYYVKPTVLVGMAQDACVVQEEIFGPVVVALPFDDLDQVVTLANDSAYGLGASIWSNNLQQVMQLIPRIKAGTVWVNSHNMIDPNMPFGGYKQSGIGREMGRAAIELYTESKSVCIAY